jgi:hypothetical protein
MLTQDDAHRFADEWIAAWNAHDLDRIMSHYDDAIVLTSPVAAERLGVADGTVRGTRDLRAYFEIGLAAYPTLRFDLEHVFWGVTSVVLYYANQRGTHTAEFMELDANGKVTRVVASYDG